MSYTKGDTEIFKQVATFGNICIEKKENGYAIHTPIVWPVCD